MQISNLKNSQISLFYPILVLLLIFNISVLKIAILSLILSVFWLIFTSNQLGFLFFPSIKNSAQKISGLIVSLISIILLTSIFFYLGQLNTAAIIFTILLISITAIFSKPKFTSPLTNINKKNIFLLLSYFILYIFSFVILYKSQSGEALLSPWETIPKIFFIVYALLNILLLTTIFTFKNKTALKLILISLHFFLSLIIATIIYKIGFGFDPFVHRAAESKLMELGYILPKPLYYIGQYNLVVFLSKILFLPISLVDKLLVPVLASLTLPTLTFHSLKNFLSNKKYCLISTVLLLILTLPLFFYTVPQSLSNLFLLLLILLITPNLVNNKKISWGYLLFALAITLIHPLSGLPAFIVLGFLILQNNFGKDTSKILTSLYLPIASIIIPVFFIFISLISSSFNVSLNTHNLSNFFDLFKNAFHYIHFYSVYHLVYLYNFNYVLLFITLVIIGWFYLKKNKHKTSSYQKISIILFINLIILGFVEFGSVIDYEQGEFIKRFFQTIIIILSPIFFTGVYVLISKISAIPKGKSIIILSATLILTSSLYLSYPHDDAFTKARGYSVSDYDTRAVSWIEQDSQNSKYIVLANQSTSAAALEKFGFKKYYNDLFYYPIPTSSPLYEIYLELIYNEPNLDKIQKAKDLTGVDTIYFVINDYWLDASKRIEQYSSVADEVGNIDNKIWIFKFN